MKAYDFDAVTYEASVYCVNCLPSGVSVDDEEVSPIFADSEWDYYPSCDVCGERHTYMNLTTQGYKNEAAAYISKAVRDEADSDFTEQIAALLDAVEYCRTEFYLDANVLLAEYIKVIKTV
jgi:hypothetical protein